MVTAPGADAGHPATLGVCILRQGSCTLFPCTRIMHSLAIINAPPSLVRAAVAKPPPKPQRPPRWAGWAGMARYFLLAPCAMPSRVLDQSTKCHSCLASVFGVSLCSPLDGLLLVAVALAVGSWACLSPRLHIEPPVAPPTRPALRRGVGAGYNPTCTYPCVCGCQFSCRAVGCGIERPCHLGPALPTS